jgi:hypothetical protein
MLETTTSETRCVQYELEIQIRASRQTVWQAIIEETNIWWLPDFHMVDEASTVEFDVRPGGRGLVEYHDEGAFLAWYSVQFYLPEQFKVYLLGNVAPDWGGPSTSNLCLALEECDDGCLLKVSDAHHGCVSDQYVDSLRSGWGRLFGEGLRDYVERSG